MIIAKMITRGKIFSTYHLGVFILEILENGTSFQQVQTLVEEKGVIFI